MLDEYLKNNGLFGSRVRFYLLTNTNYLKEDSEEETITLEDSGEEKEDDMEGSEVGVSTESELSGANQMLKAVTRLCVSGQQEQHKLRISFILQDFSKYSGESSVSIVSGWNNAYEMRSVEFIEETENSYNPLIDVYTVATVIVSKEVFLDFSINADNEGIEYYHPMEHLRPDDNPVILHGPDEINGYEGESLFIGVLTNVHNELAIMYTWFRNGSVVSKGHNQCLIKIQSAGTYHCTVLWGEELMTSSSAVVTVDEGSSLGSGKNHGKQSHEK